MSKISITLECLGNSYDTEEITKKVKEDWVSRGNKVKDMLNANLYVKPEENMVYYVVNGNTYNVTLK